jgi:Flp pilus assembly CpaF family ATPase
VTEITAPHKSGNVREINADTSHQRLLQMLGTALGTHITSLLDDPAVVELMLNPDGHLWVDRLGQGRHRLQDTPRERPTRHRTCCKLYRHRMQRGFSACVG